MLAQSFSYALIGLDSYVVTIEIDIQNGLPLTHIVGLPDNVIKESKERVRSAIRNSGYKYPVKRVTINLSPARTKKEGAAFDLAIALGILAASEQIPMDNLDAYAWLGELSLDGTVKPVNGCLPIALTVDVDRFRGLVVPADNRHEVALCQNTTSYAVDCLNQAVELLSAERSIDSIRPVTSERLKSPPIQQPDFADVKGQSHAKRGLEIAAAGGHNVLMIGPPGSGKSMLAQRFPGILPPMNFDEMLETTKIHSIMGFLKHSQQIINHPPFRQPHHTTSAVALVGGGSNPRPGEITLSHNGVLFMDELPEFNRRALESLRQPLENQQVTIARASQTLTFPSKFILLCAMNPCPCGHYSNPHKVCHCSPQQIQKYLSKISGPLMDRIDIHLEVPSLSLKDMTNMNPGESSHTIRVRTMAARAVQSERFNDSFPRTNAHMWTAQIRSFCRLDDDGQKLLNTAIDHLNISARAHDKILKLARTIADLAESDQIKSEHIAEAIQYRSLDRDGWGNSVKN